jgi:hypothetical protein
MAQTNEGGDQTPPKAPPAPPSADHGLFPEAWMKRMPVLAVLSAVVIALAALGHTLGGLGELAHLVSGVFSSGEEHPAADVKEGVPAKQTPLSFALVKDATRALDGYQLSGSVALPSSAEPGPVLPGGAKTRLVLQASDDSQIVQIDRIALLVTKLPEEPVLAFNYTVDPEKQSGFGAAQPRQFYVNLSGSSAEVFYISDGNTDEKSSAENILPPTLLLALDQHAGLQETLDLNILATENGVYRVKFKAHATSGGREYDLETQPIYIVRK